MVSRMKTANELTLEVPPGFEPGDGGFADVSNTEPALNVDSQASEKTQRDDGSKWDGTGGRCPDGVLGESLAAYSRPYGLPYGSLIYERDLKRRLVDVLRHRPRGGWMGRHDKSDPVGDITSSMRDAVQSFRCGTGAPPGYVYAVGTRSGMVKIGQATDPVKRVRDIQAMCSEPLEVRGLCHGAELEAAFHSVLADFRAHGEWFKLGDKLPIPDRFGEVCAGCKLMRKTALPARSEP